MKIHPKKCEFVVTSVVYLKHKILPNGIMAHWVKVVAILEMPNPIDVPTQEVNMKIHPKKCEFVVTLVIYLGHRILPNGIMAHWAKVVAILEMPNPTNVHTLRSFIGLYNYYKIYV
jgi:hypothetical protein